MKSASKVVVCCGEADRHNAEPSLDLLTGSGVTCLTAVVDGPAAEQTAATLARKHGPDALYVVCRGTGGPGAATPESVWMALTSNGIPDGQVLVLRLDWRDPMTLFSRIRHRVKTRGAPAVAPPPAVGRPPGATPAARPRPPVHPGRGGVPRLPGAAPPSAAAPATRPQRATLQAMTPVVPAQPGVMDEDEVPTAVPRRSGRLPPPSGAAPSATPPPSQARAPANASHPPQPPPPAGTPPGATEIAGPIDELDVPPVPGWQRAATSAATWLTTQANRGWAFTRRSPKHMAGVGAGALALIVLVGVTLVRGGDDDGAAEEADAVAHAPATPPAAAPAAVPTPAPAAVPAPAPAPSPAPAPTPSPAPAPTLAAAAPPAAAPPAAAQGPDPVIEVAPEPPPAPADDGESTAVRVVDGVTFAPADPEKQDFDSAQAYCAGLRLGGASWRLPEAWELYKGAKPGKSGLPKGVYWTRTNEEGFGDRALMWSNKKTRAVPIGRKFRGGYTLCVKASD